VTYGVVCLPNCWAWLNSTRLTVFPLSTYCWTNGSNLNQLIVTVDEIIPLSSLAVVKCTLKET
jgi:hypothetical protein